MATSEQVKPRNNNPTGKGGFGERPENRNPGGWDKDNTISYQYNRFMNMPPEVFRDFGKLPNGQKTMAMMLAYNRVAAALKSLPDIKEITDRTEGKSKESVDLTSNGETMAPVLVKFVDND